MSEQCVNVYLSNESSRILTIYIFNGSFSLSMMARSAHNTGLIFRYIHVLLMVHFVFGIVTEGNFYSHSHASSECEHHDGLASYQLFNPVPRTVTMDSVTNDGPRLNKTVILNEGVSAWVSGYALVTGYFAWEGCYTLPHGIKITPMFNITHNNNVFNCYHQCSIISDVKNIGIKEDRCYCLQKAISKGETHQNCNMETDIGVYTMRGTLIVNGPATAQCIKLLVLKLRSLQYNAVSCLEKHRCLCKCAASDNCPAMNDTMTWHECEQKCASLSKSIVPWPDQNDVPKYLRNVTYWLGSFRTFQTLRVPPGEKEYGCLSVVRYSDGFYLEPRHCTDKLKYICHNDSLNDNTDGDNTNDNNEAVNHGGDGGGSGGDDVANDTNSNAAEVDVGGSECCDREGETEGDNKGSDTRGHVDEVKDGGDTGNAEDDIHGSDDAKADQDNNKTDGDTSYGDSDGGGDNAMADQQKHGQEVIRVIVIVGIVIITGSVTIVIIILIIRRIRVKRRLGESQLFSPGRNGEIKYLETAIYNEVSNNDNRADAEHVNVKALTVYCGQSSFAKSVQDKQTQRTHRNDNERVKKNNKNRTFGSGIIGEVNIETYHTSIQTEDVYDSIDEPVDSVDVTREVEIGTQHHKDNITEDEYDRIDKPITQLRVIPEDHIYDHTHKLDNGIYNTTGSDPDSNIVFKLVDGRTQHDRDNITEDEYDRIDKPITQLRVIPEDHIYDHTHKLDDGIYNTTGTDPDSA